MTASTGETTGQVEDTPRRVIPADTYAHRLMLVRAHAGAAEGLGRSLSIREAAERAGLNYNSWANWERGVSSRTKTEDTAIISETFGVDREWLNYGGPLTRAPSAPRTRPGRHGSTRTGGRESSQQLPDVTHGYPSSHRTGHLTRPPGHSDGLRRPARLRRPIAA